jgi:two-component system, NtrC family, response regulator AtoC
MIDPYSILVVDDETQLCKIIMQKLRREGFTTFQAHTGQEAMDIVKKESVDAVLLDYMLPDMTGNDVLQKIKNEKDIPVIMLTAYGNVENAVKSMKLGAFDYLNKPIEFKILTQVVSNACKSRPLQRINGLSLLYQSEKMKKLIHYVGKVIQTNVNLLILGESGVGKTALAKWIHDQSNRREKPFVSLNCAAIPEQLMESELFGYQKGAFTGASESRLGKFEVADGGTIFLDEIGEMPLSMQAKLLHVIEEKRVMKLGSSTYRKVDVRIISATNRDIKKLVKDRRFREDLYFRLNPVEIEIPPLRERKEDIGLLAEAYLQKLNKKFGKNILMTDEAYQVMASYSWPGNIRELINVIQRLHILKADYDYIDEKDLSNVLFPSSVHNEEESLQQDKMELLS